MVSADNLNLDVLESIFGYLSGSGNDLASIALVSRSFLAGVIPRLYCTLFFCLNHAKRYPAVMSPFGAILAHPELAIHVRNIEIRSIPSVKSQLHPVFLRDCTHAITLCRNLNFFKCTVNVLPHFLLSLQKKERLQDAHVHANLTTDQAEKLVNLTKLRSLTLDLGSWNVMDILPRWTESIHQTLTRLTLYSCNELNEVVLESVLSQLPRLLGLHIIACAKVDHIAVLRLVSFTPLLECLSLTTTETPRPLAIPAPPLYFLRNLAFDTRYTLNPSPSPAVLTSILFHLRPSSPPLTSFIIKLSHRQILVGHAFIQQLLDAHAHTLRKLAFVNCMVGIDSITSICKECVHLERLEAALPTKDLINITAAMSQSATLHTLIDMGDSHVTHEPRVSLARESVQYIMDNVHNLRTIVSDKRIWTGRQGPDLELLVSFERRVAPSAPSHWFMPRD